MKSAKKYLEKAEAAAKKVTAENEQLNNLKFQTKAFVKSDEVQALVENCKLVSNEHIRPWAKSTFAAGTKKQQPSDEVSIRDSSYKRISRLTVSSSDIQDLSEIEFSDGSFQLQESRASLRVYGKDSTILLNEHRAISCQDGSNQTSKRKVNLPILMFPGIASSGLHVEKSGLDKKYEGRRLWMNAAFLASSVFDNKKIPNLEDVNKFSTPTHKKAGNGTTSSSLTEFAKQEAEYQIRSAWLYHASLDNNMVDERPGNCIRVYEGIKGCEWLVDDAIGKTQAGVWADVIKFLVHDMGYIRGRMVDAAPYDWRLPPSATETRDQYLSNTLKRVERMYKENGQLPVILCCHSMGCKMGHYFLNFCLREKGQEWIDRHIHSYMPIGAPHCGANMTVKLGTTGAGLVGFIDKVMLSADEGLILYRSWGSGPWLLPRELPPGAFPPCIVRREGELGIKITSEIDVTSLFSDREKKPKELRLTIVFRDVIHASTNFVPLDMWNGTDRMVLSFDETFYLAVPYLEEDDDDLGDLIFYLEEPTGRLVENYDTTLRKQWRAATNWARDVKKEISRCTRSIAKKFGKGFRVAVNHKPLKLKTYDFQISASSTVNGTPTIESNVIFCKCRGTGEAMQIQARNCSDDSDRLEKEDRAYLRTSKELILDDAIVSLSIQLSYHQLPPEFYTHARSCNPPFARVCEHTPSPPVVSRDRRYNTISHDKIVYDTWSATDLLEQDGFVQNMFHLHKQHYDGDPLGPTTKSASDAPPVKRVRSIYGINVDTEVSAVYRKQPVVIIGDSRADSRYEVDDSATFPHIDENSDGWAKTHLSGYKMTMGIISETPKTLQKIPGKEEQRRCCGDGTVPYWSMAYCQKWEKEIDDLTVDELEGAEHRAILSDPRFHALLKQYCRVTDPRPSTTEVLALSRKDI